MNLAPIILFVYNRPWHTKKTLESLMKNELSNESTLYVYCDGPKDEVTDDELKQIILTQKILLEKKWCRRVIINKSDKNLGLAASIISGVTDVINKHENIIVLEDDMVLSPYFLKFMNEALEYYKNNDKVWHISGWNYPISDEGLGDVFLWRVMNCSGGWATWNDKWKYFEKDSEKLISEFTFEDVYKFNLEGNYDFWNQILGNYRGRMNTWAIFWYSNIFVNNGLCVNSTKTFVSNIGFDGSGVHCGDEDKYESEISFSSEYLFINSGYENKRAVSRIKKFYSVQNENNYKTKIEHEHQYYLDMCFTYLDKRKYNLMQKFVIKAFILFPFKNIHLKLNLLLHPYKFWK